MFPVGTLSMAVTSDVEPEETATHIQRDRGLYFQDIITASKGDMLGDQTRSNIVWWPNRLLCTEWPNVIKHVWSPTKRRKCFIMLDSISLPSFKCYHTWLNTIKQGVQTGKCLITKQCLIAYLIPKQFPNNLSNMKISLYSDLQKRHELFIVLS